MKLESCVSRQSFNRLDLLSLALVSLASLTSACGNKPAADLTIEKLPEVQPQLPAVPTIPPAPYPVQYSDQSYSVYGVRRRQAQTDNQDLNVTGIIVAIYTPPECPAGRTCPPPAAPHMWIADAATEADEGKRLMVVGYAQNQEEVDEAMRLAQRGRRPEVHEDMGEIPVPGDFVVGNRVKVRGHFGRISGSGFQVSEGLLEYRGHETLTADSVPGT